MPQRPKTPRRACVLLGIVLAGATCGIKALPHPRLTAGSLAADAGPRVAFPDGGCFDCPAGAR